MRRRCEARAGDAAALKENCANIERNNAHLLDLKLELMDGLERICGDVIFTGSECAFQLPGFVCASFPVESAESIVHILNMKGIAISAGAREIRAIQRFHTC